MSRVRRVAAARDTRQWRTRRLVFYTVDIRRLPGTGHHLAQCQRRTWRTPAGNKTGTLLSWGPMPLTFNHRRSRWR